MKEKEKAKESQTGKNASEDSFDDNSNINQQKGCTCAGEGGCLSLDKMDEQSRKYSNGGDTEVGCTDDSVNDRVQIHLEALQRTMADFDNYRKRVDRERECWKRDARAEVIHEIVETLDNLERAIASTDDLHKEGLSRIRDCLLHTLKKFGLKELSPKDEPFDANLHEAMMVEINDDLEEDTVVEVLAKGYMVEDRLVRPAKVKVSKR
ncbi:MAG TPA: nucleotide exchange factor GrpE [Euryarchaeota archaeon]|nr:nucleotide exchange factor GrpE [Euryarchaeota archaeon]